MPPKMISQKPALVKHSSLETFKKAKPPLGKMPRILSQESSSPLKLNKRESIMNSLSNMIKQKSVISIMQQSQTQVLSSNSLKITDMASTSNEQAALFQTLQSADNKFSNQRAEDSSAKPTEAKLQR